MQTFQLTNDVREQVCEAVSKADNISNEEMSGTEATPWYPSVVC